MIRCVSATSETRPSPMPRRQSSPPIPCRPMPRRRRRPMTADANSLHSSGARPRSLNDGSRREASALRSESRSRQRQTPPADLRSQRWRLHAAPAASRRSLADSESAFTSRQSSACQSADYRSPRCRQSSPRQQPQTGERRRRAESRSCASGATSNSSDVSPRRVATSSSWPDSTRSAGTSKLRRGLEGHSIALPRKRSAGLLEP